MQREQVPVRTCKRGRATAQTIASLSMLCHACRLCMQQCKSWWMQQAALEYRCCAYKKPGQCLLHSALGRGSG